MPGHNVIKIYTSNSYYHVYNRGVEKRSVFLIERDYIVFNSYMHEAAKAYGITVIDHVLVKNHFHLVLFQNKERAMVGFMRSLVIRYAMYFNFKYERVGPLFQGRYRARLLHSIEELTTLLLYMEKNRIDDEGRTL